MTADRADCPDCLHPAHHADCQAAVVIVYPGGVEVEEICGCLGHLDVNKEEK